MPPARTHAYHINRLLTARVTDTQNWSAASQTTTWFSYDDLGNRMSHSNRDASAIGYAHDKANRMTTLATKTQRYDNAGSLTLAYSENLGSSYKYTHDHHNKLTGIGEFTSGSEPSWTTSDRAGVTFDALGRRIEHINSTLSSTTRYYYDGLDEILETNQSDAGQRFHVHGVSYIDDRYPRSSYPNG